MTRCVPHHPPQPASRVRTLLSATLLLALTGALTSCGPRQDLGWRPDATPQPIRRVVLPPPRAIAPFGMTDTAQEAALAQLVALTAEELRRGGVEVVEPRAFTQQLTQAGVWAQWQASVSTARDLRDVFEAGTSPQADRAVEVLTLRDLHARGVLPRGLLLFTQLVYHTEGTCQDDEARCHAPVVKIRRQPGAPERALCVVDHVLYKLVEPDSGSTLHVTQGLHEWHLTRRDAAYSARNMREAVRLALRGPHPLLSARR